MKRLFVMSLSGFVLFTTIAPVYAHISGSHYMGLMDGLVHLASEVSHVTLLLPAVVVLLVLVLHKRVKIKK
jgi:hypothetical protein